MDIAMLQTPRGKVIDAKSMVYPMSALTAGAYLISGVLIGIILVLAAFGATGAHFCH